MPPPALVIEFRPVAIDALLTRTPSTTYSGLDEPLMDVVPRSWICAPPPGAPEFVEITAPAIMPCIAFSMVGAGTSLTCALATVVMALAELTLEIVVVVPVITICSSWSTSFVSSILASVAVAVSTNSVCL